MAVFIWDASALVKRYVREVGSDTVHALFASVPASQLVTSVWAYAEAFSVLLRRWNRGTISAASFAAAASAMQNEIIDSPDVRLLTIDDRIVLAGIALVRNHNLNASDAAFLAAVQRFVGLAPASTLPGVVVAADFRLVRAARLERLIVLNPEETPAADVPAFLASL